MVKLLGILKFWSLEMNTRAGCCWVIQMVPALPNPWNFSVVDGHTLVCPARLDVCSAFQYFKLILSRI